MVFRQIFDEKLAQYAYLIGCQQTGEAIIIDPMRDIDRYFEQAKREDLHIVAAADTHIHADFLSGLRQFAEEGIRVYASDEGDKDWKYEWLQDSRYHYRLLKGGDQFAIGNILFDVQHTPGHTPEHLSYLVTDSAGADQPMGIITGDFVFAGDLGRPDLLETAAGQQGSMEASARTLFQSIQRFKKMPEFLQLWPGHGAGSACGKALGAVPESTVGYELRFNPAIGAAEDEQQFVDYILADQPEPPLYFARMKRDNRQGPALLNGLPEPTHFTVEKLIEAGKEKNGIVLDTRNRASFMEAHVEDALFSPLNKSFNTVAGSYIREEQTIYLIIEEDRLEEAVRDLIRIGLDKLAGFVTPAELEHYFANGGAHAQIKTIDFNEVQSLRRDPTYQVVDVRKASEFEEGHIDGAVNIAHTRLLERKEELPKNKTLLVHCRSGKRAAVASALLARHGFKVNYIDDLVEKVL